MAMISVKGWHVDGNAWLTLTSRDWNLDGCVARVKECSPEEGNRFAELYESPVILDWGVAKVVAVFRIQVIQKHPKFDCWVMRGNELIWYKTAFKPSHTVPPLPFSLEL